MPSTQIVSPPSHLSALLLWLTTMVVGSAFTTIAATFFILGSLDINAIYRAGMLCIMVAVVFSTPALLVLPLGVRWALAASAVSRRIRRLLLLIGSLFGIATLLLVNFVTDPEVLKSGVLWFAGCYVPVAIAAIYWLYADWIFLKADTGIGLSATASKDNLV